MIRADIEDTVERLKETIAEAPDTSIENLHAIYLAGGSSRIPLVKQLIEENLGMEPDTLGDPKEVISRGAVRAVHLKAPAPEAPSGRRQRQKKTEQPSPPQEQPEAKAEEPRQEKVMPPPPPPPKPTPAPAAGATKLRTHFVFSIVSILLFWPTAIPAIVYATRARTKLAQNDVSGATRAGKLAFRWCMISLVIFVGVVTLAVIGSLTHHASSSSSY
jgi:Interferon-induced transmembrane protein/Hsp70 protein